MKHSEYTALFREIAGRHMDIQHTAEKMHFARMILSRDPYLNSQLQIGEFIDSLRNKLHTPCMLIASFEADYRDNRSDSTDKALYGRMIILDEVKRGDFESEEQALDATEQIGEECLAYLANILEEELPQLGMLEWNGASSEKLSGISSRNMAGTAFNFYIVHGAESNIEYNPDKFID